MGAGSAIPFSVTEDFQRALGRGYITMIVSAAKSHNLDPYFALAVGYKETRWQNIRGDDGHGCGIMQVDDRSHPVRRIAPNWETVPGPLVLYGVGFLKEGWVWSLSHYPDLGPDQRIKVVGDWYNEGQGGVTHSIAEGDADRLSAGGDYGTKLVEIYHWVKRLPVKV